MWGTSDKIKMSTAKDIVTYSREYSGEIRAMGSDAL